MRTTACGWTSWLVALTTIACGGEGDPATPDGGGDGAPLPQDGGGGEVTVSVRVGDSPALGADVVFHSADGAALALERTGPDGRVRGSVAPGGMVTVLHESAEHGKVLFTYTDVQPGDALEFTAPVADFEPQGSAAVTLPGAVPGAAMYLATEGCLQGMATDTSEPVSILLMNPCLSAARTWSVLVVAVDADFRPVAYTFLQDQAIPAAGAPALALPSWREDFTDIAFGFTGLPAGVSGAGVSLAALWSSLPYDAGSSVTVTAPASAVTATARFATAFGRVRRRAIVEWTGDGTVSQSAAVVDDDVASSVPLAFDTSFLPQVASTTLDDSVPSRPVVSWTTGPGGLAADLARAEVSDGESYSWMIALPPHATSARYPELPAELAAWLPPAQALHAAALLESGALAGWDEARPRANQELPYPARYSTIMPQMLW